MLGVRDPDTWLRDRRSVPEVVLIEPCRPPVGGAVFLRELVAAKSSVRVLVIGSDLPKEVVFSAGKLGALDVLDRPTPEHRPLIERGLSESRELVRLDESLGEIRGKLGRLSDREGEVLRQLAEGGASRSIAHALGISKRTIDYHRSHILEKLEVASTGELIGLVIRMIQLEYERVLLEHGAPKQEHCLGDVRLEALPPLPFSG